MSCAGGREVSACMGTGAAGPAGGQGSAGPIKVAARICPTSPHSAHLERLKEHCTLCPFKKELDSFLNGNGTLIPKVISSSYKNNRGKREEAEKNFILKKTV